LKGTIFEDIPNELVLIPFINRKASTRLSKETLEWLQKTVGSTNYEEYEFMGDAIINLIARVSIFDPETYSNG
jgi:dsRNA-specific ribonuclease